ncbi:MAG TPA: DinB family protein [Vicinamibacteria bacterium]|nr:DinB family protein [Vicinamibacteria bacterium]
MYTTLADFEKTWAHESESTLACLKVLTDASLAQSVTTDDRTLGRIAWHLVGSIKEMMERTGLKVAGPADDAPVPSSAHVIATTYKQVCQSFLEGLKTQWSDETLRQTDSLYGETWKRGFTLDVLVRHQTHHRGQMTVLMRQAGLRVPGVYGPAREDWAAYGQPPPVV